MRRTLVALVMAMLPAGSMLQAQQPDTGERQPALDLPHQAVARYNSSRVVLRATTSVVLDSGRDVQGDVAVLNGPLTIGGHVAGSVVAINSDVLLQPSARIDGDLLVVGGDVEGRDRAYVAGEISIYRGSLHYRQEGDSIVVEDQEHRMTAERWWRRWEQRRADQSWSKIQIASAGAYNRVEGLPINLGPQIYRKTGWGSVRLDAYAILRTGSSFTSTDNDVGHHARGELRIGRLDGFALGGSVFNTVEGVESWQLSDLEVGLASFLAHRDYRDYFQRHGGSIWASLFARRDVSLVGSFSDERWLPRTTNDPFTLFYNDAQWRPNPLMDIGRMHVASGELTFDTRSDRQNPWSGWYAVGNWERGVGTLARYTLALAGGPFAPPEHVDYTRGFLDVRRYNRLGPDAQLNFRAVLGGWLNGSPLPLERRLSVDGPGTLPGFGFRSEDQSSNVGTCTLGESFPGQPAMCDRIALAQVEYRGDLHFDFNRDWNLGYAQSGDPSHTHGEHAHHFHHDGTWVLFADAGRGWLVGSPADAPGMMYSRGVLPPLSTFRTDLGAGVDFDIIGFYAAKALSSTGEPLRFFVRLRHRF